MSPFPFISHPFLIDDIDIYRRYRLLIIGGGPAGVSILVRAIRLGFMHELCTGTVDSAGVCVLDKGTESNFGGGRLLEYEVRIVGGMGCCV
jgi:flavin-dependent dehydrogenase